MKTRKFSELCHLERSEKSDTIVSSRVKREILPKAALKRYARFLASLEMTNKAPRDDKECAVFKMIQLSEHSHEN